MLTVPVSFQDSIQSAISQFVNFRTSPKIGHATFFSPGHQDGLGIFNPKLQQGALQLRWLRPWLSIPTSQLLSHSSIVLSRLVGFLCSHLHNSFDNPHTHVPQPLDHRISMISPGRRPPVCKQFASSWSLLFQAMDRLPQDFSSVIVSAATCLEIPLTSVVLSVSANTIFNAPYATLPTSIAYNLIQQLITAFATKHPKKFPPLPTWPKSC